MPYVVVNRFTTAEDLTTGTYDTPKDLYIAITAYSKSGETFITDQETTSGILLDSAKRDSILSTFENASYVIVDDYVSVDQTMTFDSEAHYDEWTNWKGLQTFSDSDQFTSTNTYEDTWTKTLVSEG